MKDRVLNALMLFSVAAALILTLLRGAPESAPAAPFSAVTTATPHPADAYRQRRADTRQREKAALTALIESADTSDALRRMAETQLRDLLAADETELALEAALAGEGFPHGLCICRSGKITLMADRPPDEREAALLLDLAREISGFNADDIRIWGY